jgi:phage terminase small subunit
MAGHIWSMALTPQQEKFAVGCVELCNQSAAYRQAYDCSNWAWPSIHTAASRLAADPEVAARIQQLRNEAAARQAIPTLEERIKEQRELELADPGEIIGVHWDCCRHCYGLDHRFQWKDEQEYAIAFDEAVQTKAPRMPDMAGGFGFNQNREPVATCTNCWGVGISRPYVADTRKLSKAARRLYKGIKVKADGSMEILLYDQQKATDMLNRIQGAYKDAGQLNPAQPAEAVAKVKEQKTPEELQRGYLRLVSGG